VDIPVTVKTRLGVDDHCSYGLFRDFVGTVVESGITRLIAHARQALLAGLSPKENREVPPLHHDWVYRLKREMPELVVVINGGVDSVAGVHEHLAHVDGVMLGRAAYQTPWLLAECQAALFGDAPADRESVVTAYGEYLERKVAEGVPVKHMTRHVLGLFQGRPGAKAWRRYLSENAHRDDGNHRILAEALEAMRAAKPVAA
jgi:tRNA-dihydrouridine synthase A